MVSERNDDEQVLFRSDILLTGWIAAENAGVQPGDRGEVRGCGPTGLFAVQSTMIMGAERVLAIDPHRHRLDLARGRGTEVIDYTQTRVLEALMELTGGLGPGCGGCCPAPTAAKCCGRR